MRSCEPTGYPEEDERKGRQSVVPVINIRAALCILLVLALVTTAPVVAADDDDPTLGPLEGKCVKISPFDVPPVSVYDCPDVTNP